MVIHAYMQTYTSLWVVSYAFVFVCFLPRQDKYWILDSTPYYMQEAERLTQDYLDITHVRAPGFGKMDSHIRRVFSRSLGCFYVFFLCSHTPLSPRRKGFARPDVVFPIPCLGFTPDSSTRVFGLS